RAPWWRRCLSRLPRLMPRAGARHYVREATRTSVTLRDHDRMQLAIDVLAPEVEEFAELGELGRGVEFLPDESLQLFGFVGQAIDDLGRGQPVSGGVRGSTHRRVFRSSRRKHGPAAAFGATAIMPQRSSRPGSP